MISIDFSLTVALFTAVSLGALLVIWVFSRKQKDKELSLNPAFIWFCSVCTYNYVNTKEDKISVCPRCGSYNKKE
ncbi:MAG: hypothetical protein A3G38_04710 [Omnitrophica WOR_2 bacterium RIFCSPLOWO2_12_FULL_51_8]|nr:MAG: hypothetical protein A3G38_04710 [Omnitrophica WOR_2 bacterium RIFCSPLOWO2_12_FULL_51_8]